MLQKHIWKALQTLSYRISFFIHAYLGLRKKYNLKLQKLHKLRNQFHFQICIPVSIFSSLHIALGIQNKYVVSIMQFQIFYKTIEEGTHHINVNLPKTSFLIPLNMGKVMEKIKIMAKFISPHNHIHWNIRFIHYIGNIIFAPKDVDGMLKYGCNLFAHLDCMHRVAAFLDLRSTQHSVNTV